MSFEGEIVAAPLIIGAAAVYGGVKVTAELVKGTAAVAVAAGKAIDSAIQQAKINSVNRELNGIMSGVDSIDREMKEKMDNAREICYNNYTRTVDTIAKKCEESPDMDDFITRCNDALNTFNSEMQAKREEIEKEYIGKMKDEVRKKSNEIKVNRALTTQSIERMSDDMKKRELAKQSAQEALVRADDMINAIKSRYENSLLAKDAVEMCRRYYEQAKNQFDQKNYESALISANSVMDTVSLRVEELMEDEIKCSQRYIDVSAMIQTESELIEKFRTTEYKVKKKSGDKTVIVENFTEYYRGAYEECVKELDDIKILISDGDFRSHSPEELEELFLKASKLQKRFITETSLATERLDIERKRKSTAKHFIKEYLEQGYEMVSLTDDERSVSSLDSTILKFKNPDTDDMLIMRLNSVENGGHIAMTVDIEDFTNYEGNFDEIERKREELRIKTSNVIEKKTGGKMLVKQRCKNPGRKL